MKQNHMDSDVRFRKIIENNYSGITLLNANFEIIYRSPSAERITGWTTEKRAPSPIITIVHPEDQQAVLAILEKVVSVAGLSVTFTFRTIHYNGHLIWLENTYTNMLDDPDINAIVCNFRDVTAQKYAELELKKQADQIAELLQTITDGFIALDENLCYTYVNKQATRLLGRTASSMIGQHIWTLFPDAVGSATYDAIQTAYTDKKYVCNEDFYAPLQLWQENRVYPSAGGVSVFVRDITKQKKEQHHLKLLESVITNTTDAILITEAEPFDEPGNRIIYVNEAFTHMTGYTLQDVAGKTTRMLQGTKTDKTELKLLGQAIRRWESCDVTVINYKKNGEEFWNNFSVSPVADETGWFTHWISIDKDVTGRKNEELKNLLLADISLLFNSNQTLIEILDNVCKRLIESEDFLWASIYLVATDQRKIKLVSRCSQPGLSETFGFDNQEAKTCKAGEGLPGLTWATKSIQCFDLKTNQPMPAGRTADGDESAGSIYGVPLFDNQEVIGVLVLATRTKRYTKNIAPGLFAYIGDHLGTEVTRKQQEEELNQIFNFAPDVICIAGTDGYFKKVNPALCKLLEYTKNEMLGKPLIAFIHPDDQQKMTVEFNNLSESRITFNFETRTVSKSGKIKWLVWSSAPASEHGLLFCTAKDVTEKKELESLLNKVTHLARIGGWEIDLVKNTLYWSEITKEIHEVAADFEPDLRSGIAFYENSADRAYITRHITYAIENGSSFDFELPILTAKGNKKWVRVVGEPELSEGKCTRIFGSFQDVDVRVRAEHKANEALLEKNTILESIGDAFFAVDSNWTVNYWNSMAAVVLGKSKAEMIDQNLWSVFSDSIGSESYQQYHLVLESKLPAHFEDYYATLDKWYEISAYPSANGLSVYFKDITDRKRSQHLLEESEKKYSELFQLSPLPKWVFDVETLKFLDVNEAGIHHYGYSREEFLAMTIKDIRPAEELPVLLTILARHRKQQQFTIQGIVTHQKKNGERMLVEIQSNDIEYKGRKARVIIANDITERINYIKAIEKQNEKLKEISWMQSHVIRAPLSRIMGLVQLLDDLDPNVSELKQVKEYIKISADELDAVIRDITDKTIAVDYKPSK